MNYIIHFIIKICDGLFLSIFLQFFKIINFTVQSMFIKFFRAEQSSNFYYDDDECDHYDDYDEYHDEYLWEIEVDDKIDKIFIVIAVKKYLKNSIDSIDSDINYGINNDINYDINHAMCEDIDDDQIITYGEVFWPWLRCFIYIWISFIFVTLSLYTFDIGVSTAYTISYAYGINRFWLIYTPVCGWFLAMFYNEYTDEGQTMVGTSDFGGIVKKLKDIERLLFILWIL